MINFMMCILSQLIKTTKVSSSACACFSLCRWAPCQASQQNYYVQRRRGETFLLCVGGNFFQKEVTADYVSQLLLASWVSFGKRTWKTSIYIVSLTLWREQQALLERTRGWKTAVRYETNSIVFFMESC